MENFACFAQTDTGTLSYTTSCTGFCVLLCLTKAPTRVRCRGRSFFQRTVSYWHVNKCDVNFPPLPMCSSVILDGFEFDAYDYGCEDIPNSFFNSTAVVLPPFLSERDLCMFKLPPSTVEHIEVQDLTDSAETLAPLENRAPVTVLQ